MTQQSKEATTSEKRFVAATKDGIVDREYATKKSAQARVREVGADSLRCFDKENLPEGITLTFNSARAEVAPVEDEFGPVLPPRNTEGAEEDKAKAKKSGEDFAADQAYKGKRITKEHLDQVIAGEITLDQAVAEGKVIMAEKKKAKGNGAKKSTTQPKKTKVERESIPKSDVVSERRDDVEVPEAGLYRVNGSYLVEVVREGDSESYTAYAVLPESSSPEDTDIAFEGRSYRPVEKQRTAYNVIRSIYKAQTWRGVRGHTHDIDFSTNTIVVSPKKEEAAAEATA